MGIREEIVEMKKEVKAVKEEKEKSLMLDILTDYKKANKRLYIILIIVLCMWFITGAYLVYTLNDIGTIEETTEVTQDNENGYNNYVGNDGDITNGKANN